jgi:hypothetical protein
VNELIAGVALTQVAGEPRVRDIDLAVRLGFVRPRAIRQLIERNIFKIERYGTRHTVWRVAGKGNRFVEYWLNRRQMMVVCMAADTVDAIEVQDAMILVFDAFTRGELTRTAEHPVILSRMLLAEPTMWRKLWPHSTARAIAGFHRCVDKWDGTGAFPSYLRDDIEFVYRLLTSAQVLDEIKARHQGLSASVRLHDSYQDEVHAALRLEMPMIEAIASTSSSSPDFRSRMVGKYTRVGGGYQLLMPS